jgi:flavin reductase (DIM6/NTAB) family NADH-FMN oxidoreductase RutF
MNEAPMFYEPHARPAILKHDPFKALIVPRPIGWVTTMSRKGETNLAPYSYFNAFNSSPGVIGFSSESRKDSVTFAEETREFVWNLATYGLRDPMNETSAPLPRGVSEFDPAGLETEASRLVRPPRIKGAAAALECKWLQTLELKDLNGRSLDNWVVFGQVVGVHIDDRFIKDGKVDTAAMRPIARLGYNEYSVVDAVFSMQRPKGGGNYDEKAAKTVAKVG